MVHHGGPLNTTGAFVERGAWDWEAESGVFPLPKDITLQVLGCGGEVLPRWRAMLGMQGARIELEFVLTDTTSMLAYLVSRSENDQMMFEVRRPITFLLQ